MTNIVRMYSIAYSEEGVQKVRCGYLSLDGAKNDSLTLADMGHGNYIFDASTDEIVFRREATHVKAEHCKAIKDIMPEVAKLTKGLMFHTMDLTEDDEQFEAVFNRFIDWYKINGEKLAEKLVQELSYVDLYK